MLVYPAALDRKPDNFRLIPGRPLNADRYAWPMGSVSFIEEIRTGELATSVGAGVSDAFDGLAFNGASNATVTLPSIADLKTRWGAFCIRFRSSGALGTDGGSSGGSAGGGLLIAHNTTSSREGWYLTLNPSGVLNWQAWTSSTQRAGLVSSAQYADDVDHTVFIRWGYNSGDPAEMYVDGVLIASDTMSGAWSYGTGVALCLGDNGDAWWEEFDGVISLVSHWSYYAPAAFSQILAADAWAGLVPDRALPLNVINGALSASGAFVGPSASIAATSDVDVSASSALSAPIGSGAASIDVLAAVSAALGAPISTVSITGDVDVDTSGALGAPISTVSITGDVDVDTSGALGAPSPIASVTIDTGGGVRSVSGALVAPSATISATSTVLAQISGAYGAPSATVVATISGGLKGLALIATRVFQHFNDNFPSLKPTVKIAWDGVPFDPETDVPTGASWVRISVLPGDRRRVTVGQTARRRRIGLISVQTFAPAGDGLLDASDISDDVEAVFDRATIAGLRLGAPRTERAGQVGAWFQLNTFVPFQRDDDD